MTVNQRTHGQTIGQISVTEDHICFEKNADNIDLYTDMCPTHKVQEVRVEYAVDLTIESTSKTTLDSFSPLFFVKGM